MGVIIELLSGLLKESSIVEVATILLYSRLEFSDALDARELLEYGRSSRFDQELLFGVPFSSLD